MSHPTSTANLGSFCLPSSLSLGSALNNSAAPPLIDDRPQKVTSRDGHYEFMRSQYLCAGTYSIVYKAQDCATDQTVVIKQMKVSSLSSGVPPSLIREVSLLHSVRCPHIIRLLCTFWTPSADWCLVFEHYSMDLAKFMSSRRQDISVALARKWAHQMLSGLHYLHERLIMHRDLKPQNILLTFGSFDIKIADFGLGKQFFIPLRSATLDVVASTLWYRAPELLLGCNRYGPKIDVWSVGCIMAEVVTLGQPLFDGYGEWEMLMKMFQFLGTPDLHAHTLQLKHFNANKFPNAKFKAKEFKSKMGILKEDRLACHLIKYMLTLDWSTRLNANQLLQHPWFKGMDDVTVQQISKDDANGDDDEKTFGNETKTKMISSENRFSFPNLKNERMEPNEEDKHSEVDGKKATQRNWKRKQMGINDDDGIVGMKHACL